MTMQTGTPNSSWDKTIARLGGHLYQSSLWARFQQEQERTVYWDSGRDWAWLGALRVGRGGIRYLYIAYGPTLRGARSRPALDSIRAAGETLGVDFVRFEPIGKVTTQQLTQFGAKKAADFQPRAHMVRNLTGTEAELRAQMNATRRNEVSAAERAGLEFTISTDPKRIADYMAMQAETTARARFSSYPASYFEAMARSLFPTGAAKYYAVAQDDEPLASSLSIDFAGTRYYLYAAAYYAQHPKSKAPTFLLWNLLRDARRHGLKRFDYGGVAPDNVPNHPYRGHTNFKQSFGPAEIIETLGTWEIPLRPAKYHVYKLIRRALP